MEREVGDCNERARKVGGNPRVSHQQKEEMLSFMLEHPALATNKIQGPQANLKKQQLWVDLSDILNDCPTGASKTPEKWAKVWQDWRCDTRQKVSRIKAHASSRRGPPLKVTTLSEQEKKLLQILEAPPPAADGNWEVQEPLQHLKQEATPQKTIHTATSASDLLIIEISQSTPDSPVMTPLNTTLTPTSPAPIASPPSHSSNISVTPPIIPTCSTSQPSSSTSPPNPSTLLSFPLEDTSVSTPTPLAQHATKKRKRDAAPNVVGTADVEERLVRAAEVRAAASKRKAAALTVMARAAEVRAAASREKAAALTSIAKILRETSQVICETLKGVNGEFLQYLKKE